MIFSKSFGYAVRSILYIALSGNEKPIVPIEEIAEKLRVPRHFLSKVMNRMVKEGIINSKKGPAGGFYLNGTTLQTKLTRLMELTRDMQQFSSCVMSFRDCNPDRPCPLHYKAEEIKKRWHQLLSATIEELIKNDPNLVKSIVSD